MFEAISYCTKQINMERVDPLAEGLLTTFRLICYCTILQDRKVCDFHTIHNQRDDKYVKILQSKLKKLIIESIIGLL